MTDVRLTALNPVDSQVYPVACNTSGELIVEQVDPGPDLTVTGDLTVDGDAEVEGSVSFANSAFVINSSGVVQTNINSAGNIKLDSTGVFTDPKIFLKAGTGEGIFDGDVTAPNITTLNSLVAQLRTELDLTQKRIELIQKSL